MKTKKNQVPAQDFPFVVVMTLGWGLFIFIVLKYLAHQIHDPDVWWHLANGRAMMETHSIIKKDIFSHTLSGVPWINFEWLSQIGMYLIVKAFDLKGLYYAKIGLGILSLGLLFWLARISGARGPFLFFLTWLGYHILKLRLCTRVELITFCLLPLSMILLLKAQKMAPTRQKQLPWMLAALMVLWSNAHAGYIYGLLLLAMFALGARWAGLGKNTVRLMDRSFTLALIASLINPYGFKLAHMFLQVALDFRTGTNPIAEWADADVKTVPFFWASLLVCGILMVRSVLKGEKWARFWIPSVLLFSVLASLYQRTTAIYAFIAIPFLAEALRHAGSLNAWMRQQGRAALVASGLVIVLLYKEARLLAAPMPPEIVDWKALPAGAARFVQDNNITGRLFNSYGYGGFLSWTLGPERKIFMDGRYPFYSLLQEKTSLLERPVIRDKDWQTFFSKYGVDHALTKYFLTWLPLPYPQEPFPISMMDIMFPPAEWALVYWDDNATVFLKRIPRHENTIKKTEFKAVCPYNLRRMRHFLASGRLRKEDVLIELERHKSQAGETAPYKAIKTMVAEMAGVGQ